MMIYFLVYFQWQFYISDFLYFKDTFGFTVLNVIEENSKQRQRRGSTPPEAPLGSNGLCRRCVCGGGGVHLASDLNVMKRDTRQGDIFIMQHMGSAGQGRENKAITSICFSVFYCIHRIIWVHLGFPCHIQYMYDSYYWWLSLGGDVCHGITLQIHTYLIQ